MEYRHTQVGWALILILGGVTTLLAALAVSSSSGGPASIALILVIVLLLVCLTLFFSLTVIVDDGGIELRLGPGVIRRRIELDEIESFEQRHLPWWAVAYGIRMSLDGKRALWRVSGSETVDLVLAGGRRLLIGTDEPEALAITIEAAIRNAGSDG